MSRCGVLVPQLQWLSAVANSTQRVVALLCCVLQKHKCDTYGGQSGSPMWIAGTNTILGVVSWEQPDINGACAVNAYWYRFVRSHRSGRPLPKRLQSGGGRHH